MQDISHSVANECMGRWMCIAELAQIEMASSLRREACLLDIRTFLSTRPSAQQRVCRGIVKVADAAHMVVSILGITRSDESFALSCRTMRQKIEFELGSVISENELPLRFLAECISKFCKIDMSEADLVGLWDQSSSHLPAIMDHPAASLASTVVSADSSMAERLAEFHDYTKEDMKLLLVKQEEGAKKREQALLQKVSYAHRCRRNAEAKCRLLEHRLVASEAACGELVHQVRWREGCKKISPFGGYSLALLRNKAHVGAKEAIAMIARDEVRGAFKSKNIVVEYEHKAATAQKLISKEFHDQLGSFELERGFALVEAFVYKGDATNQEALDKCKIHVSTVDTIALHVLRNSNGVVIDIEGAQLNRARCDLQVVSAGTGQELYFNALREFASIGAPSWEARCLEAASNPKRLSLYSLGLDKGPDCQLFSRLVCSKLYGIPNVACITVWCLLPSNHLCYKCHLSLMESFEWKDVELPCKFHSAVATISNVWRSPGIPHKLAKAVAEKFGEEAAHRVAKRPGRAVKGRWSAAHEVITDEN